jgi:hypothetical protein
LLWIYEYHVLNIAFRAIDQRSALVVVAASLTSSLWTLNLS